MKKVSLLLVSILLVASFSSCSLFGDKEGEYKPKERISRIFEDYDGDGKMLREVWNWDKKVLSTIDHYYDGDLNWTEEFTYNKKGQVERVDCYRYGESVEYKYDGNKLSKSTYYYEGTIEEEYAFKYDGKKISEIEIFYFYKSRKESRLLNEGFNPVRMLLPSKQFKQVNNFIEKAASTKDGILIKLEWDKDNVSKMTLEAGTERLVFDYKYDDKLNPYTNFYDMETFYDEDWDYLHLTYSKNNVTELRETYTDDGETETDILKYSYSYDGKFPTVQRCAYTYSYERPIWDDYGYIIGYETETETITVSTYYEYE